MCSSIYVINGYISIFGRKGVFHKVFSPCINLGNKAILDDEFLAIKNNFG
jgi:hypothetical protein